MTNYNKSTLATFFETNDVPQGSDYANLINSQVNIVETSLQTMGGPLGATELITPRVSATNVIATVALSAASVYADNLNAVNANITNVFFSVVSAGSINLTGDLTAATGRITASAATVTGNISVTDVSANTGTVYASAVRSTNGMLGSSGIVSAAGTAQGTAALLTNVINRGKGIVDGTTTGFTPLANRAGLVQYLLNEGVSANLWPPTGGFINGLATNIPFPLVASAAYTIFHITASSYGVK